MKSKYLLFLGIALLSIGIVMRVLTEQSYIALSLLLSGVMCKILYIANIIRKKEYKPGFEFAILGVGVSLFITGVVLRHIECMVNYRFFMYPGIVLKATFVVIFILKHKRIK